MMRRLHESCRRTTREGEGVVGKGGRETSIWGRAVREEEGRGEEVWVGGWGVDEG